MNIGFATSAAYPSLTDDDRPLLDLLRDRGATASAAVWDDPSIPWASFDAVVLRSTWDYHLRVGEFETWLHALDAAGVRLWNPTALVRWNMHKRYLRELGERGIQVPPTEWVSRGDPRPLASVLRGRGWSDAVVKPAISASATETWHTTPEVRADGARYARLVSERDVLVQLAVPEIRSAGEWSLVFIAGAFSHATVKRPRPGDFRVQVEHGGSVDPASAPAAVVDAGRAIADALERPWLYARVDGVATAGGFVLMEVECIEPHLFLAHAPGAHERFAQALLDLMDGKER